MGWQFPRGGSFQGVAISMGWSFSKVLLYNNCYIIIIIVPANLVSKTCPGVKTKQKTFETWQLCLMGYTEGFRIFLEILAVLKWFSLLPNQENAIKAWLSSYLTMVSSSLMKASLFGALHSFILQ